MCIFFKLAYCVVGAYYLTLGSNIANQTLALISLSLSLSLSVSTTLLLALSFSLREHIFLRELGRNETEQKR
jgi:hypothetical protein